MDSTTNWYLIYYPSPPSPRMKDKERPQHMLNSEWKERRNAAKYSPRCSNVSARLLPSHIILYVNVYAYRWTRISVRVCVCAHLCAPWCVCECSYLYVYLCVFVSIFKNLFPYLSNGCLNNILKFRLLHAIIWAFAIFTFTRLARPNCRSET